MRKILFLIFSIFIFQNAIAEEQKLSEAYEQQLLERVKQVFSLETPLKLEHPICATPIFVEINFNKHRFSAKTYQLLKPYISRPDFGVNPESTYNTPSGHFKIHYTTTGTDAIFQPGVDIHPADGVPDYVNRCADFFDSAWAKEVDSLGYSPPLSDDWYQPNGGDGKYDIYLKLLGSDFYGYTQADTSLAARPISLTSFIVVQNDYSSVCNNHEDPLDCLRATAAHEFFHAIQFSYDGSEFEYDDPNNSKTYKYYWIEMSATWMEDIVFDQVNDYLFYLGSFFRHPEWSLKTFGTSGDELMHPYGACVWPIFLSEKLDVGIIKDIWEECAKVPGNNAIDYPGGESATDKTLKARGSTFEDAFREFTVWNYFTGSRARTLLFYSEGNLFPQINVEELHSHNADTVYSPSGPNHPYGLGSNYIVFKPTGKQGGIKLAFSPAEQQYNVEISAVGYNENVNEPIIQRFQINNQTGSAKADVYNWTSFNQIIMIPAVIDRNGVSIFPYSYSAEYDSSLHGDQPFPQKDWIGQNFPNPFVIKSSEDFTFFPFILSSVTKVEIDVFSVSGEKIWSYPPPEKKGQEWTIGEYIEPGMCPVWNGKNQKGEYVVSGVYLYQVKTQNSSIIKKLVVIR